jgi:accessory gene regulator protein AgrB
MTETMEGRRQMYVKIRAFGIHIYHELDACLLSLWLFVVK